MILLQTADFRRAFHVCPKKGNSPTDDSARPGHGSGASFSGRHGAGLRGQPDSGEGAGADGVRVCAQRHRHAQLESGHGGQTRGTAAHSQAHGAAQRRHAPAGQPDAQYRARAAGRRGRSRPLLRVVSDRRAGEKEPHGHPRFGFVRPTGGQPDWRPDAVSVARTGPGRRAPIGRLRFGLLLRLHQ